MYLERSISVILHVLLYFILSHSCGDKKYLSVFKQFIGTKNRYMNYYDAICSTDSFTTNNSLWAHICKNVVHRLRSDAEFSNMYVNYPAFKDTEKCKTEKVWIPSSGTYFDQPLLICNVRSSVIPLDTSDEFPENSKIFVFPKNKDNLMVFTYSQINKIYQFRNVLHNFHWTIKKSVIPPTVFDSSIGIPKSYSTFNGIYNQLHNRVQNMSDDSYNSENFVIKSNFSDFRQLCRMAYSRAKYFKYVFKASGKPKLKIKLITLRSETPEKIFNFAAALHRCPGKETETSKDDLNIKRKYHVAAGPDVNSMILIVYTPDNQYIVTEYITNIDLRYIHFLDYY